VINNDAYKYKIESHPVHAYMFNTTMTINSITKEDYGEYYCVSKNILGLEKIVYRLGTRGQYGRISDGDKPVVSGETPPVLSYEDVCPPQEACPFCPAPS
jgi:Immunoglobulin domain